MADTEEEEEDKVVEAKQKGVKKASGTTSRKPA